MNLYTYADKPYAHGCYIQKREASKNMCEQDILDELIKTEMMMKEAEETLCNLLGVQVLSGPNFDEAVEKSGCKGAIAFLFRDIPILQATLDGLKDGIGASI